MKYPSGAQEAQEILQEDALMRFHAESLQVRLVPAVVVLVVAEIFDIFCSAAPGRAAR